MRTLVLIGTFSLLLALVIAGGFSCADGQQLGRITQATAQHTSPEPDPFIEQPWDECEPPVAAATAPATRPSLIRLDPLFTDHMVLQRDSAVPVWGSAPNGTQVTIAIAGQRKSTIAAGGKWMIRLDPLKAGGPYELTTTTPNSAQAVRDVLVGDVWVCSGQSNMELQVRQAANAREEIEQANYPQIRLNSSSRSRGWVPCTPANVGTVSATGYYFARDVHRETGVPIGLLVRAVGGTVIRQWTPKTGAFLEGDPQLLTLLTEYQSALKDWDAAMVTWNQWKAEADRARAEKRAVPKWPTMPPDPRRWGGMFEGQILPLMPLAIKGVLWYQGETDARTSRCDDQYRLLPLMIQSWRKAWGQGDFPFLTVQLANDWGGSGVAKAPPLPEAPPENHQWPWVRDAQATSLALPNTGLAVTIDIGGKIHFPNKQAIGRRLSLIAQSLVYHKPVTCTGPAYKSMQIEGDAIRVTFKHRSGPLVVQGETLGGFAIAGEDRKFYWADATIEGETVIVRSTQVARPVAVRYAWANDPHANLYNQAGLPAAPFRTDKWPRTGGAVLAKGPTTATAGD